MQLQPSLINDSVLLTTIFYLSEESLYSLLLHSEYLLQLQAASSRWPCFQRIRARAGGEGGGNDVIVGVFSRWRWTVAGMPLMQPVRNAEGI